MLETLKRLLSLDDTGFDEDTLETIRIIEEYTAEIRAQIGEVEAQIDELSIRKAEMDAEIIEKLELLGDLL